MTRSNSSFDVERGHHKDESHSSQFSSSFSNAEIRNAFIRKVYAILACQFAVLTAIATTMAYNDSTKSFVKSHEVLFFWSCLVGSTVSILILGCVESCRRTVPQNFILLSIFTVCMSINIGYICIHYKMDSILFASGLTFIICISVSLFSYFTTFDFTKWFWVMGIVFLAFFVAGFALIFFHNRIAEIIYSVVGVVIFTIYLAIDTQIIIGGRTIELSPEEYILAAIHLFLDIVNIFLFLLRAINNN